MNKLLSALSAEWGAEETGVKKRKGALALPKGLQRTILNHFDKYYLRIPRTPVPHLFKSNGVPSDEDLAKMHAYIRRLQRIVISSETSPSSIERYRGNRVYRVATRHTRLLAQTTIRNLPPEIIQRIVYFSLEPNFVRKECLPWVASWVCSSWRRTVLGHHHLWAILPKIYLAYTSVQPGKQKILQELLRRSGDAALWISISDVGCSERNHSHHEQLLDLLLEHAHRYVDVRLNLNSGSISSIAMPILSRSPRFRHFTLIINTYYGVFEPPRLDFRKVTESLGSIEVPWNLLSQVVLPPHTTRPTAYIMGDMTDLSFGDWLRTLDSPSDNRALSLTKLVLPTRMEDRSLGVDLSPVFAPPVTEIVLYDHGPALYWGYGALMVFQGFVTPCLNSLKVFFGSTSLLESLATKLSQTPLLTTLHLLYKPAHTSRPHSIGLSMTMWSSLSENAPNIVNLKLSEDPSTYSFIHLLAHLKKIRKDWESYPLPRLKNLTILVRSDIRASILDLLHYVAVTRMERPPPFGDAHFDRMETLEVVLGDLKEQEARITVWSSLSTVKEIGLDRYPAPHAAQDRVRGVMEEWVVDPESFDEPTTHVFELAVIAEKLRDVRGKVARLSQSVDQLPPSAVFADAERCLSRVVEGLGGDGSLTFGPIENVYVSSAYYDLCGLKETLESECGWRMPGFSVLNQTSVQLAARILEDWKPRLAELASRTRWFNVGLDRLIFLRLDDRALSFISSFFYCA